MWNRMFMILIALSGPFTYVNPVSAQIVSNGSFEAGFDSWVTSGSVGISGVEGTTDGFEAVLFNSGEQFPDGVISQAIPTVPGGSYTLEFDWGAFGFFATPQTVRVEAIGNAQRLDATFSDVPTNPTTFAHHSIGFVADSSITLLAFTDRSMSTMSVDGILDNVSASGPLAARTPTVLVRVVYGTGSINFGPVSFGLSALPATFVATFALEGFSSDTNITAGLSDIGAAAVRFGDGSWTTHITSFSLVTNGLGEVTTLSYATGPLSTATATGSIVLDSSFSATIQGTDISSGQPFEYNYGNSLQTLVVQPVAAVPMLGLWGTGSVIFLLAGGGIVAAKARRRISGLPATASSPDHSI